MKLLAIVASILLLASASAVSAQSNTERLWEAARQGDVKTVEDLLAMGVDVNSSTRFGATALWFAASKDHFDVVQLLLKHKANVDLPDKVWGVSPLSLATGTKDKDLKMVRALLRAGAKDCDGLFLGATASRNLKLMQLILQSSKVSAETLGAALLITPESEKAVRALLEKAGAKPLPAPSAKQREALKQYTGDFESDVGAERKVSLKDGRLRYQGSVLKPLGKDVFQPIGSAHSERITFARDKDKITGFTYKRYTIRRIFFRSASSEVASPENGKVDDSAVVVKAPRNWPSFRGVRASGVADGQHPPISWDVTKPSDKTWKTKIPGFGHSSPIVWGDRVFVTTAISSDPNAKVKTGQYGAGASAKDRSKHEWQVYCISAETGKVLWRRTACEGVPKSKRHTKATHANATPVTDGKHVVAYFASEGLHCYDFAGKLLWKRDLGRIDVGAFADPDLQWEAASSPIIYKDRVILQCDQHKGSFIAALSLEDGRDLWRTPRDEPPSWATPTIYEGANRVEVITNGANFIRGYDARTGKELWRLGPNSQICVPTPITGQGLIFVANGYRPIKPIYALRPGAMGDVTLKRGDTSNEHVAWSVSMGSSYLPSPLVYREHFYVCSDRGVLSCYEAKTGKRCYRKRLSGGSSGFTASPVAADGRIYCTSESGKIIVIKAGPQFEQITTNEMKQDCLATPAIANGRIFIRTAGQLYGIGRSDGARQSPGR